MFQQEFDAGEGQAVVVYQSDDTGTEIEAASLLVAIAADAAQRARQGRRIVTMTSIPLRHSGAFMGREGSGFETKVAVVVVYGDQPG
jgi:hypothetical protein